MTLSRQPSDVWSMNNMALVLIQQGRFAEALPPLARAVQLDSSVAVFHNNLGMALERTGHYTIAAQSYRSALSVDSTYKKAASSLTGVEQRVDDPSLSPIDLADLAETFDGEIRTSVVARQPKHGDAERWVAARRPRGYSALSALPRRASHCARLRVIPCVSTVADTAVLVKAT